MRDEHAALDIVQDAMLKLAERYGDHPAEEYPMLFQRILQNTIRDYYRRQKVRSFWTTLMTSLIPAARRRGFRPVWTPCRTKRTPASRPSRTRPWPNPS